MLLNKTEVRHRSYDLNQTQARHFFTVTVTDTVCIEVTCPPHPVHEEVDDLKSPVTPKQWASEFERVAGSIGRTLKSAVYLPLDGNAEIKAYLSKHVVANFVSLFDQARMRVVGCWPLVELCSVSNRFFYITIV